MELARFLIVPVAVLGAAIGSFLNVVIYRWPRGLSIGRPRWSFCTICQARIRPQHNVPLVGWLWLRGRCHSCGSAISVAYPVVEAVTAIVFVVCFDALFVSRLAPGVGPLARDWPLGAAYLFLFAGLIASAGMDIESYTIDIRISLLTMLIGVAAHAVAGLPMRTDLGQAPTTLPPGLAIIAAGMGAAWLVVWIGARLFGRPAEENAAAPHDPHEEVASEPGATAMPPPQRATSGSNASHTLAVLVLMVCLAALTVWAGCAPLAPQAWPLSPGVIRVLAAGAVCMTALILSSWQSRPADDQIIAELEGARHEARSVALREAAWLLPAVAAGAALFIGLQRADVLGLTWAEVAARWTAGPLAAGALAGAFSAVGAIVWAAALGWSVRILGTLAFGKEAFGSGDIYLMAAIGAVCGFWMVVLAFFLAAVLALIGVVASVFHRTRRAIPFGPWLALAAFVGLGVESPLIEYFRYAAALVWGGLTGRPAS